MESLHEGLDPYKSEYPPLHEKLKVAQEKFVKRLGIGHWEKYYPFL